MHDNGPHPLLAQVPLIVSPSTCLPAAPTLPYTYKQMPSSLPPSATGIGHQLHHGSASSPSSSSPASCASASASNAGTPDPAQQAQQHQQQQQQVPKYVISPVSGSRAHPSEITAQCQSLLGHLERMQADAQRELDAFEARRKEAELAERRKIAPGWLDREERLLVPISEGRNHGGRGDGGGIGNDEAKFDGMGKDILRGDSQAGSGIKGREEDEEKELANAVRSMDLGEEIDRAFGRR